MMQTRVTQRIAIGMTTREEVHLDCFLGTNALEVHEPWTLTI